jgi:glycosyltransferase involved in cell wall biosynthesis
MVLAYFFPPLGGAGVQRVLKFVKYLPEHGFAPIVITTRSRRYRVQDTSLAGEIPPGTPVIRALDVPVLGWVAGVLRRLGLRRAAALVSWPDLELPWALAATLTGWRAIRRDRPDVLFTTSSPYSSHLAGWLLHRLTGVPWVADFRDEWAAIAGDNQPLARLALTRRAEAAIAASAERVVVVADYFEIAGSPAQVEIPNGVDVEDLEVPAAGSDDDGVFRLSFVGSLYADRDPAPVLAALRRLIDRGVIDQHRFELRIVGNVWIEGFDARSPVPLVCTGYVDHGRAVAEMRAASALLFYVAPGSLAPSGKLFEYLGSERPVLCVSRPENLAWRLVEEWSAGRCAPPEDSAAIEAALADLYKRWEAGTLAPIAGVRESVLERYSRRRLAGELAAVLADASER